MNVVDNSFRQDFSARLHDLRSAELRRVADDARVVLHGGAAGAWYFDWFEQNYRGSVERHIGVEAFSERPDDLPSNVEWVQSTLGDMSAVGDASVDMVFGGQVIEHLWADDLADFLAESHRVLRADGLLVLDSPNRRVTEAIRWHHPEHTAELSVDEIADLLAAAGFTLHELRGVLLGYDRLTQRFLDLEDERMSWEERARLAPERPEDSFVWWLSARRCDTEPEAIRLREAARMQADAFRARRLRRLSTPLSVRRGTGRVPHVASGREYVGPLFFGPDFPLDGGTWRAFARLRLDDADEPDLPVARLDVISAAETAHVTRDVLASELGRDGAWTEIELQFELSKMVMGLQIRAFALGGAALGAQLDVALLRVEDVSVSPTQTSSSPYDHRPEPRTVEIMSMLRKRALAKARGASARIVAGARQGR